MLISFHIQTVYCLLRQGLLKLDCLGSIACRRQTVAMHARLEMLGQSRLQPCSMIYR
jgi:hypothetical protein